MSRVATISAQLVLDAQRFDRSMRRVKNQFKKLASDSKAQMAAVGATLGAVAIGLGGITGNLKEAGDQALRTRKALDGAFPDPSEIEAVAKAVRELGATPPFTEEQFSRAAARLKTYEKETIDNLTRIGNAAVTTGVSFNGIAEAFAGFGRNDRATKQLEKLLNIKPDDLVRFGAVLNEAGTALDVTGQNAEKAQKALEALFDDRYSGNMDRVVQSSEVLRAELNLLAQDIGVGLAEAGQKAAGFLAPLVKRLRDVDASTKKVIGLTIGVTGFSAAFGAAAIGVGLIGVQLAAVVTTAGGAAVVFGTIAAGIKAAAAGMTAFALAGAPVVLIVGAAVAAGVGLAKAYEAVRREITLSSNAQREALQIELRRAEAQKDLADFLGKSGKELYDAGRTAVQTSNAILALHQQIEQAAREGNDGLVERLKQQVIELREARNELSALELNDREAYESRVAREATENAKTPDERKAEAEAIAKAEAEARREALEVELDAIELRLAQEKISQAEALKLRARALDQFEADEKQKRALIIETARFEVGTRREAATKSEREIEQARADRLQNALSWIQVERLENRMSAAEEIKAIGRILAAYELKETEKRNLLRQTSQIRKQIRDDEAREAKRQADEEAREAKRVADELQRQAERDAKELQNMRDRAQTEQVRRVDTRIGSLQEESDGSGKDNSRKIREAFAERLRLQVQQIQLEGERAKAATTNAELIAAIEKNTQSEIRKEIESTAQAERNALTRQLEARKKFAKDTEQISSGLGDIFDFSELNERMQQSLNVSRRQRKEDLEIEPPDLEAIEERLTLELTSVTAQAPALEMAIDKLSSSIEALPNLSAAVAMIPSAQAQPATPTFNPGSSTQSGELRGSIDLSVRVTGSGEIEEVRSVGLDGRFTEITRSSRGMKGRISLA